MPTQPSSPPADYRLEEMVGKLILSMNGGRQWFKSPPHPASLWKERHFPWLFLRAGSGDPGWVFCAVGELRSYPQSDGISSKQFPASQVSVYPESQNMTSFENGIIVAVVREDDVILAWAGALPQRLHPPADRRCQHRHLGEDGVELTGCGHDSETMT